VIRVRANVPMTTILAMDSLGEIQPCVSAWLDGGGFRR
jgi:hypothetical protein